MNSANNLRYSDDCRSSQHALGSSSYPIAIIRVGVTAIMPGIGPFYGLGIFLAIRWFRRVYRGERLVPLLMRATTRPSSECQAAERRNAVSCAIRLYCYGGHAPPIA